MNTVLGKIPAEMLDEYMRLQTSANDHQIRSVITFSSHLDIELLKNSIQKTFIAIPLLTSGYVGTKRRGHWIPRTADPGNFLLIHTVQEETDSFAVTPFLTNIPDEKGPQLLFQVIRTASHDVLIITVNHMVMDGSGFKFYLYFLAGIYSGKESPPSDCDRRIETVLKNIPPVSRIGTLLKSSGKKSKNIFLNNVDNPAPVVLNLLKIVPEEYYGIKAYCKIYKATLNDFIICLFARTIFEVTENNPDAITIQVMFDLRRYAKNYPVSKYGNFASMESLTVYNHGNFSDMLIEVHRSMNKIKADFPGIKNIMLMHAAYSLLPVRAFNSLIIGKIRSFGISTSNLGVIDSQLLRFSGMLVTDAYMLTSIKKQPALQLTFSTFGNSLTASVLGEYSEKNAGCIKVTFGIMKRLLSECLSDNTVIPK